MTESTRFALRELQELDHGIRRAQEQIAEFGPSLEEMEGPALELQAEVENTGNRLRELKIEERRLELAADEKRARSKKLQERMNTVRNLREEAAVHAEIDLLRRALEADEQEALGLLDQIRKLEERLEELQAQLDEAQAAVEPKRKELLEQRESAEKALHELVAKREAFAGRIDQFERRIYENIKAGGRDVVVSEMTADGACGHCFSVIPLQLQANVRNGEDMIRCEACGVILAPPRASE